MRRGGAQRRNRHDGRVDPRLGALDRFVRTFADRGASAHAPADSLEAYRLGRKLGASGVASTAWATADGVAVLHSGPRAGSRLRRSRIGSTDVEHLPDGIVTVPVLYRELGVVDLLLGIIDDSAFEAVVEAARAVGDEAERRLWLTSPDLERLVRWRPRTSARLINTVRPRRLGARTEQLAAELQQADLDGLLLHHLEWNGGRVALLHRFHLYGIGWGVEHEREIAKLLNTGIDGVSGAHTDRLAAAAGEVYPDSGGH